LNITCNFTCCDHQLYRDFLIILYNATFRREMVLYFYVSDRLCSVRVAVKYVRVRMAYDALYISRLLRVYCGVYTRTLLIMTEFKSIN
jgi:hypothetical protein